VLRPIPGNMAIPSRLSPSSRCSRGRPPCILTVSEEIAIVVQLQVHARIMHVAPTSSSMGMIARASRFVEASNRRDVGRRGDPRIQETHRPESFDTHATIDSYSIKSGDRTYYSYLHSPYNTRDGASVAVFVLILFVFEYCYTMM